MINLRTGEIKDIDTLLELQKKFHISTISEEDKKDGFVTTLLSKEEWENLINEEDGVILIEDDEKIIGYALQASWQFWSKWPLFQYMINDLKNMEYKGEIMTTKNSYQYGPICLEKEYRNTGAFEKLFFYALSKMENKYKYMLTFVNKINPRSFNAHTNKAHLDIIKEFDFNNNHYWCLGCPTQNKVK